MTNFENPRRFEDPRAQAISDKWLPLQETATVEEKDKVGFLYVSKVLRLGDDVARDFADGISEAYSQVGMVQSAIPMDTDVKPFWEEVKTIFPDLHTEKDINFLCEEGGVPGVLEFTYHLDPVFEGKSPMLRRISLNAVDYK
jgi:hypothetical protein